MIAHLVTLYNLYIAQQRSQNTRSLYGASEFASLDFNQIMASRRQATDKGDAQ